MQWPSPFVALSLALFAALGSGCQGSVSSGGGDVTRDGGGGGRDGGGPSGVDGGGRDGGPAGTDGGGGMVDAGGETPFDAGPCAARGLAASLSTRPLAGASPSGRVFAAATDTGGAVVAWDGAGSITVQRASGDGSFAGAPATVEGTVLYGLDTSSDAWGVMVSRGSDALYLVSRGLDGSPRFEVRLLGEVPHDVTNNEWFGALIRYGRLDWDGTRWAAYYTVNRLWPDGIAHYGDQLRFVGPDGGDQGMAWDWGCSHSMEVRIAHNGTIPGPVCASDCYPSKGIHFNHRSAELYPDESGSNCAGGYGTSLGGVVPMSDGFWVSFTATDGRASHDVAVVKVGNDRRAAAPIWLTADGVRDSSVQAARYGTGFVVAWNAGGTDRIAHLDASGATVEGPVDLPALGLAAATDFFVYAGGDVGWVTTAGGTARLARLRACD